MSAGDGAAVGRVGGHRAVRVDLGEDGFELFGRVGADLDAREAGVVLPLAELELLDVVPAAARQDRVEHLRQQQRIDDVARHLDVFDKGGLAGRSAGIGRLLVSGCPSFYRPARRRAVTRSINRPLGAWVESEGRRRRRTGRRR